MRILFNTMGLGKGGAERVINILSNEFIKHNEVKIITNIVSNIDYKFDSRIKIKCISNSNLKRNKLSKLLSRVSVKKVQKLKKEIILYKPDVIISFLPESSFRLLLLKRFNKEIKKIPVIVSVRNDPNKEYNNFIYKFIMKKLYPYANELVLQTQDSKLYFEKEINKKGIVIANPVSNEFMVKRYNGSRKKTIVAVGRLQSQKNYKVMIDAFDLFCRKHTDYTLKIFGDGNLKNKILEYINSKKLCDKIKLMGKVDNIKDHIYDASMFVMSSDYEGMPNSLLEALCLGVPCISSDCPCGGPKELIENEVSGFLFKVGDHEEMANKMINLIENKKKLEKFSVNSNKNQKKYAISTIVEKWYNTINHTIERRV